MAASLLPIVRALGGDLYAGGTRANVPASGHSRADRSVSLLLVDGRVIVHSFGDGDWRAALRHLQTLGFVDEAGRLTGLGSYGGLQGSSGLGSSRRSAAERIAVAQRLWDEAWPLSETSPGGRHVRIRGVVQALERVCDLRSHSTIRLSVFAERGRTAPGLIAAIRDPAGRLTAVEIVYLGPNARRLQGVRLSRKTVGVVLPGSAVRLAAPGRDLLVGEGVFSVLSASERFGRPGWALLSAHNLAAWSPPPGVASVLIAADRGPAGERAAGVLADRLAQRGIGVRALLPPPGRGDWNDLQSGQRPETVGDREKGKEGRTGRR
jgi:putative DNA primase/helicase